MNQQAQLTIYDEINASSPVHREQEVINEKIKRMIITKKNEMKTVKTEAAPGTLKKIGSAAKAFTLWVKAGIEELARKAVFGAEVIGRLWAI